MDIIIVITSLLFGALTAYFLVNSKLSVLKEKNIQLAVMLSEKEKHFAEKIQFVDQVKSQMTHDFRNLATDILEADRDKLKSENNEILSPLQGQLASFRERIEAITTEQVKERATLAEQIKGLQRASIETQASAQNLTNALTHDNKRQGDWGEMVLSSILSSCGLREGYEFETQGQYKNEQGESFRPDVIVHLPQEKDIVIDSKVSLKDYVEYIADQSNDGALKKHIKSIETQIKNISIKEYENLEGVKTLDFIFIFIPIESALWVALEHKRSLFDDALKKNIMLVSPSTLTMSLKTINYIWQTERQTKNAEEIARQAGAMYDKLAGFVAEMDKIEKHLNKAKEVHTDARKKLSTGPGNLIGRAEKLRTFGVQTKKEIGE
jgi:DNA recombination protein RmuC